MRLYKIGERMKKNTTKTVLRSMFYIVVPHQFRHCRFMLLAYSIPILMTAAPISSMFNCLTKLVDMVSIRL